MFCRSCGNEVGEDARFCDRCGQPVADGAAETAEAVTEPSSGTVGEHVGSALASARRRIPLALLVALVALGVASVAFAAYMVWSNVVAPAIEQAEQQSGEAPPAEEVVSQGEKDGSAKEPANASEEAQSQTVWVVTSAWYDSYPLVNGSVEESIAYDERGNKTMEKATLGDNKEVMFDSFTYDENGIELGYACHVFETYDTTMPNGSTGYDTVFSFNAVSKNDSGLPTEMTKSITSTMGSREVAYTKTILRSYDEKGTLRSESLGWPASLMQELEFDEHGWVTAERQVETGDTVYYGSSEKLYTYTYDDAGNATSQLDSSGAVVRTFVYDENGNVTEVHNPDGSVVARFTYQKIEDPTPGARISAMRKDQYILVPFDIFARLNDITALQ